MTPKAELGSKEIPAIENREITISELIQSIADNIDNRDINPRPTEFVTPQEYSHLLKALDSDALKQALASETSASLAKEYRELSRGGIEPMLGRTVKYNKPSLPPISRLAGLLVLHIKQFDEDSNSLNTIHLEFETELHQYDFELDHLKVVSNWFLALK